MKITKMNNMLLKFAGSALLIAALLGTGFAGTKKAATAPAQPAIDLNKLVWPPEPDVARIKYQTMYSGEDDLNPAGVKKHKATWMDKAAGVSLPQEDGKPRLQAPYGAAFDSKGHIYVADAKAGAVFIFNVESKKVEYRGFQNLSLPSSLAIDDADRLFVSDSNAHDIFVFTPDGKIEGGFGQDQLERPVGLAIDNENRYLYAVDAKANRVAVFDADSLQFLRYVGKSKGKDVLEPGVLDRPIGAAVDSEGNLYITDTFNARVQVFDADGNFLRMWGKPGNTAGCFMRPKGIAIDRDDHIYVVDAEFNNVQVFNTEGEALLFFGGRGLGPGVFTLAVGIAVDKQSNRIVVTEQWSPKIQIFSYVTDEAAKPLYQKKAKDAAEAKAKLAEKAAGLGKADDKAAAVQDGKAGDTPATKDSATK